MSDVTGVAEALLGLPGFRVLEVSEGAAELVIEIEAITELVGCPGCGVLARTHGRMVVEYRDLPAFGRPARLVWRKRRYRCEEGRCATGTWSEESAAFSARCLLTDRAGAECCRQVGRNARPVTQLAAELGVCWDTVMDAVREHGEPLVDDPHRVGAVRALGVDETTFLTATKDHGTLYATGMVDLDAKVMIDVIEGNSAHDLGSWLDRQPTGWLGEIRVVATDLAESYRAGLEGRLNHAIRVADPFHVVRIANRCLDQVRRRVQNQTLGHRGRKRDPLYRIRKLMLTGTERLEGPGLERMLLGLRVGDPDEEVLGAWLAKEHRSGTSTWPTIRPTPRCCSTRRSRAATPTRCPRWNRSGARSPDGAARSSPITPRGPPTGPEGLNLLVKKVKRAGHGFRSFANYRLRILLHAGGVNWPAQRPPAPQIRTRSPR